MTLQEAKSIARHLGFSLRQGRSGDYRMNFRDGYQTTDLKDAVKRLRWPVGESCTIQSWRHDLASPELQVIAEPAKAEPVALPMPHFGSDEQMFGTK
jgi:hypothetical protein